MQKLFLFIILNLLSIALVGCLDNGKGNGGINKPPENAVKKIAYQKISPVDAKKRLDTEKGIILLDVRTLEEFTQKHIPGSILIPVTEIEIEAPLKLKELNAVIFVYCRSGNRSETASKILLKLGYANVYDLGGINDWTYETETGTKNLN